MHISNRVYNAVRVYTTPKELVSMAAEHRGTHIGRVFNTLFTEAARQEVELKKLWQDPSRHSDFFNIESLGTESKLIEMVDRSVLGKPDVPKQLYVTGSCESSTEWTLRAFRQLGLKGMVLGQLIFSGLFEPASPSRLVPIRSHHLALIDMPLDESGREGFRLAVDFTGCQLSGLRDKEFLVAFGPQVELTSYLIELYFSISYHHPVPQYEDVHILGYKRDGEKESVELAHYWAEGFRPYAATVLPKSLFGIISYKS